MTPEQHLLTLDSSEQRSEKIDTPQASKWKYEINYVMLITFVYWHLAGVYGLYLSFTTAKWATIIQAYIIYVAAAIGVHAGAHRLWTHRAYKAKLPMQILLMVFNTFAFQSTAIKWVKYHRLHHKYSDTDADPHNASRGLFFSHIGWILVREHPEVRKREKHIDMSDIYSNPVLTFQEKYAIPFIGSVCFIIPTLIPVLLWGELLTTAWHITVLRYMANMNSTCLVNSVGHLWGNKPYDKNIFPTQNIAVSLIAFGDGFHNYHHAFPWDYRASELGNNYLNISTKFIDFFAWLGWAYDLKSVSEDLVRSRKSRTGDGTNLWGWGDKDMSELDRSSVEILNKCHD